MLLYINSEKKSQSRRIERIIRSICVVEKVVDDFFLLKNRDYIQRRSEGTSSVAFEVLIINCHIEYINLFIFNCLTSNIKLLIFNCLMSNFCFPKNMSFTSRRERLFMDARLEFRILNSPGKMMTYYLRDTDKFLRYRTLCPSILKCGFPKRGIKLTWFVLFEVLEVPQL